MSAVTGFFSAVFWGLLVLSLLVVIHEGGHFIAARCFGVRVTEFYLGLPFRFHIAKKSRRFGTEFGVTPLLLGGYNRICGMEIVGVADERLAEVLACVQRHGRVRVSEVASELGIDEADAYEAMAALVDYASIRPYYDPELEEHPWQSEWPTSFEALERDGQLRNEYDADHDFSTAGTTAAAMPRPVEDPLAFLGQERSRTYSGKGFFPRLVMLLAGPASNVVLTILLVVGSLMIAGVETASNSNVLGGIVEGSYAEEAGLQEGDTILKIGALDVASWDDLSVAADEALAAGGATTIVYERGGETHEAIVHLPEDGSGESIGLYPSMETYRPSLMEALQFTFSYISYVASQIARLIIPTQTVEVVSQSSSIVGISAMASEAAASGVNDLILFAAAISLSLGFMNLLPIPPLDGGKIVIELVQFVTRRPLSQKAQNIVSYVGLAFVLFIFCFALKNDLMRIIGGM